jgi:ribosome-associated heat shock protein Hsp15
MDKSLEAVPADLWLWAARLVKTRAAGAEAIAEGRVTSAGEPLGADAEVRRGDRVELAVGESTTRVLVRGVTRLRGPERIAARLYQPVDEDGQPLGGAGGGAAGAGATKSERRRLQQAANVRSGQAPRE